MKDNKSNNVWKVLAIVFIVISVIEFCLIAWAWTEGTRAVDNENFCVLDVCADDVYDSFYYDSYNDMCYCYTEGEVTHQEYLR